MAVAASAVAAERVDIRTVRRVALGAMLTTKVVGGWAGACLAPRLRASWR